MRRCGRLLTDVQGEKVRPWLLSAGNERRFSLPRLMHSLFRLDRAGATSKLTPGFLLRRGLETRW